MNLIKASEIKTSVSNKNHSWKYFQYILPSQRKKKSIDDREQFSSQNSPTTLMQDTKPWNCQRKSFNRESLEKIFFQTF